MQFLYQSLLYLHIAAGSLSFITGGLNMILPKGGKRHRKIGRLFITGMMLTEGSALFMAQIKPNPFLFIIGVFTIYLVGTADRYIKLKQNKPLLIDWVYTLGMFVFGSVFIIWGIITLTKSDGMGAVMLVFGSIGLYSVYRDFNYCKGEIAAEKLMHKKACHPMDFTGRPMKGYVFIDPEVYDLEEDLLFWLDHSIAF